MLKQPGQSADRAHEVAERAIDKKGKNYHNAGYCPGIQRPEICVKRPVQNFKRIEIAVNINAEAY
jgi:hypothetical protein